ncbi:methylaspartate mutase subunit E [Pseudovibrio sp. Tun.PSC04-5.I4]|uniref:methylaspartate mutase subunit E n=1 Tax=Pseudovibrio sp. Tun.PSC04-5.I4 TaxID=1798213 RepID=UPI00088D355B|nr:methylaspartate mutase subunit E [Pseudovibrio sp. Tun.PSC04-5.I4]SDR47008.1 Glutamate mutase subunit E [Pseudovibrio sp. Tun.PSC04-5.I4]
MSKENQYNILLAGIGGDAHSVGLILLNQAICLAGYNVYFLGIQNDIKEVIAKAKGMDVVMISCMDGHAHHYLRDFPRLSKEEEIIWYLGGNPSVLSIDRAKRLFKEIGFQRVFLSFVDLAQVIKSLKKDLNEKVPRQALAVPLQGLNKTKHTELCIDSQVSDIDHDFERNNVLLQWKTGADVRSLRKNAVFLADCPNLARLQMQASLNGEVLIQPRSGVAEEQKQLDIFKKLEAAGAPVLSYQVDSLTRNNNYSGAEQAIIESRYTGVSALNGFPVVNHGAGALQRIALQVSTPLQCRHSTRDPRLLAEICFGGGVTAFEGGAICYNLPYYKDYSVIHSIQAWKYVDRLVGRYYEDFGIIIDREFFGVLTATLIPPSIAIAVGILESALAAKQGVKAVSIGYAEQGNRIQDVAAIQAIPRLTRQFFRLIELGEIQISTVFHQYMAAFPEQKTKARDLIRSSSTTACLSKATRMLIKTSVEALRIPYVEENVESLQLVREGIEVSSVTALDWEKVLSEINLIEEETMAILNSVLELGRGDVAQGLIKATEVGVIDIPFSPSIHNAGKVITARDVTGAVRFLNTGALPFSKDVCQFHAECMAERSRRSKIPLHRGYEMVEQDICSIPKGALMEWPISKQSITEYECKRCFDSALHF